MSKCLFLESVAGVAGDMFAAAFVDAGLVTRDELNKIPEMLGLDGVSVSADDVIRATIRATHLTVSDSNNGVSKSGETHLDLNHSHHSHTHYPKIDAQLENSPLDANVKTLARKIFRLIAEAEADAHGIDIEKVAFHEVGTVDSIVDVVMAAYCINKVCADEIFATPVKPGRGMITIQHGTHPVPPPASIRLLKGMPTAATPEAITRENLELSTPTGIAILKALEPKFVNELPAGTLLAQGIGSGTLDLGSYPNVFRISLLETASATNLPYETDTVIEIACNIDDDTAEHLAWIASQLLEQGALDVWQTPATGKKGRVLVCISVLVNESDFSAIADWILRNSTTFGVRYRKWDRLKLARRFEEREKIQFKVGSTTDGVLLKEKPEFDDIVNHR